MESRQKRAREVQDLIADILRRHWDPIGIGNEPRAQDEYDAYVGGVYRLLASGASARTVAEHLAKVESDRLGFVDTDPKMLLPVARRLVKLNVRIDPDGPAA
jgi:hypothetical protein